MTVFAPFRIPLARRLQTAALLTAGSVFPICLGIMILGMLIPFVREALLLYLLWAFVLDRKTPRSGGRPFSWVQHLRVWDYVCDYFPAQLVIDDEQAFDKSKTYVFGIHPHGCVITLSAFSCLLNLQNNWSWCNHKFDLSA